MARIIVTELDKKEADLMTSLKKIFGDKPNSKLVLEASFHVLQQAKDYQKLQNEFNKNQQAYMSLIESYSTFKDDVQYYFEFLVSSEQQANANAKKKNELEQKLNKNMAVLAKQLKGKRTEGFGRSGRGLSNLLNDDED